MRSLFLIILIIISCLHVPNKKYDDNSCDKEIIELPIILHFNSHSIPPLQKIYEDISESSSKFYEHKILLKFIDIKFDSPKSDIKYEDLNTEYFHDREVIHVYFVNNIIALSKKELIVGFAKTTGIRSFIVISLFSQPTTFAHEIGHYFALSHVNDMNNIMDSDRSRANPNLHFDEEQIIKMKNNIKRTNIIQLKCHEQI